MLKTLSFKETGPSCGQKLVLLDNSGQNIKSKVKKISKLGQEYKRLILNFDCFLTAIVRA